MSRRGGFPALLGTELKKALGANPWLWVCVAAGSALALYSALYSGMVFQNTLDMALEYWDVKDLLYSAASLFTFWLPINPLDFAPGAFTLVWPLLAAIPYAWSWSSERRSGLLDQQFARAPRRTCWLAKAVATFAAGALAVMAPLVVNLVANACLEPADPVWVSDVLFTAVGVDAPLSSLFYTNPLLFCVVWTVMVGVIAGLWAVVVMALSMAVGNFLETLVASYLFLHVLAFVGDQVRTLIVAGVGVGADPASSFRLDVFNLVAVKGSSLTPEVLVAAAVILALAGVTAALALRRDAL